MRMKGNLQKMFKLNLTYIQTGLLLITAILGEQNWPYLLLTSAQILFVPLVIQLILQKGDWYTTIHPYLAFFSSLAIVFLQITGETQFDALFAALYLCYPLLTALFGLIRFLKRGFSHVEEFSIEMGMMYLALGGGWFFAYMAKIDLGFSPLLTWLTAIHFHYSACLLPIFVGFLGRMYKPKSYGLTVAIILSSPMIVAAGITFSSLIEIASVIIYMIGIYQLLKLAYQAPYTHPIQKWLVRLSFSTLGVTILFSMLYALRHLAGLPSLSINFMLIFHGFFNAICFALLGVFGWSHTPVSGVRPLTFPVSGIRGGLVIGDTIVAKAGNSITKKGLVENMHVYKPHINPLTLSPAIIDFYENTTDYRLFTEVHWLNWFKPFACVYRLISKWVKQINLPLSSRKVEMTGTIVEINEQMDGRDCPRAWVRKIDGDTVFVALYSSHEHLGRTYMNIALPLPWSTMTGVLDLQQVDDELELTSKSNQSSDAGIYLAIHNYLPKLPIEEIFRVKQTSAGTLSAKHTMWIFGVPFLKITYRIHHKENTSTSIKP